LRRRISSPKRRWSGQLGDIGAEFESVDCRSTLTLAGFRPTPEWQQFSIFSLVGWVERNNTGAKIAQFAGKSETQPPQRLLFVGFPWVNPT